MHVRLEKLFLPVIVQPIHLPLKLLIPQGVEVVTTTNVEEGVGAEVNREEVSIPDIVVTRTKIKMRIVFQNLIRKTRVLIAEQTEESVHTSHYSKEKITLIVRMIGRTNESTVIIDGQSIPALIDRGSDITTMSDTCFNSMDPRPELRSMSDFK